MEACNAPAGLHLPCSAAHNLQLLCHATHSTAITLLRWRPLPLFQTIWARHSAKKHMPGDLLLNISRLSDPYHGT